MSALAYRGSSCNRPAMIALKSSKIFGMTGVNKSRPHLYGEMHSRASKMIELRFGLNRNVVMRDKNSAREDSAEGPRRGGPAHDDRAGMARGVNMGSAEYENKASDSLERQNAAIADGGQTTFSPPCKGLLQSEMGYALTSGVDSMTLAIDLQWRDSSFFRVLEDLRAQASANECPMPGVLHGFEGEAPLAFEVKGFGKEGYQWLITSPEYAIKLGRRLTPRSRPSAMIDIRCETLWMRGVVESIDRIVTLLKGVGAHATNIKLSRVDLCLDLLVQAPLWSMELSTHAVTRARRKAFYQVGNDFTGVEIGGGDFMARMYDKGLEIRTLSHKDWMLDLWNLDEVPENFRVIRIEFQLRREAIKQLGLDSVWDFTNHPGNLWAYCTQAWLKFTDNPNTETRFQNVLPFWRTVQDNFLGSQRAEPLIRAKAVNVKRKQLAQQLMGQFTSLIAIGTDNMSPCVRLEDHLAVVSDSAKMLELDDDALSQRVRRKQGKYLKAIEKFKTAEIDRKALGFPQQGKKSA